MKMLSLVSEHLEEVKRRYTVGGQLPVKAKRADVPIFAASRWQVFGGFLKKSFQFLRQDQRDRFVVSLLGYEAEVGHHATITIMQGGESTSFCVDVSVATSVNGGMITELDKEYARNADIVHIEAMRGCQQYILSDEHQD